MILFSVGLYLDEDCNTVCGTHTCNMPDDYNNACFYLCGPGIVDGDNPWATDIPDGVVALPPGAQDGGNPWLRPSPRLRGNDKLPGACDDIAPTCPSLSCEIECNVRTGMLECVACD